MSESKDKKPSVEYNWVGPNCGIKVSNICLGAGLFGTRPCLDILDIPGLPNEVQCHAILDRFCELGGNFIDTANVYGDSEEIIGKWLQKRDRSSVVVGTKVRLPKNFLIEDSSPNEAGLSRGSILTNLDNSLKRLQTDYIDLYYSHYWDAGVKLEETLRTFNDVVRSGKVRYIGLSNVTGTQLQKIVDYNQFMGFNQCVTLQQEYSLLERNSDIEIIPACKREGVSLIPFTPLKGFGLLTGKFKRNDKDAAKTLSGTRLGWTAEKPDKRTFFFAPHIDSYKENEDYWTLMSAMENIGRTHGKNQTQVALRWLLQKDFVSSVVIGPKTIQQLEDNMEAGTGWKLTDEQMKELDELSQCFGQIPNYPYKVLDGVNASRVRL